MPAALRYRCGARSRSGRLRTHTRRHTRTLRLTQTGRQTDRVGVTAADPVRSAKRRWGSGPRAAAPRACSSRSRARPTPNRQRRTASRSAGPSGPARHRCGQGKTGQSRAEQGRPGPAAAPRRLKRAPPALTSW